jgi:hypothetical protein
MRRSTGSRRTRRPTPRVLPPSSCGNVYGRRSPMTRSSTSRSSSSWRARHGHGREHVRVPDAGGRGQTCDVDS